MKRRNAVLRTVLSAALGFVVGLIVLPLAVFFGYVAITEIVNYHDFEGATGMGMISIMPIVGLIGGVSGAVWFAFRANRKRPT